MSKRYGVVQKIYISVLLVYLAARNVMFMNDVVSSDIWTVALFAVGLALAVVRIFSNPRCLAAPQMDFILVFYLVTALSCIVNVKYGIVDNVKALAFMFLFFFFWFPLSATDREERSATLRHIASTLCCIYFVLTFLSIIMYLFAIDYEVVGGVWGETNQGFSERYMRLWGVYHDPNYAGAGCISTIFAAIYLCKTSKKRLVRVLSGVNIALQMIYISLSGSRASAIVLMCATACYCVYSTMGAKKAVWVGKAKLWCRTIVASGVLVVVCFAVLQSFLYLMPYVQKASYALPDQVIKGVCGAYESIYERSGLTFLAEDSLAIKLKLSDSNLIGEADEESETPDVDTQVSPIKRTDAEKFDADISNGRFVRWSHMIQVFTKAPILGTSPKNVSAFAQEHCPDTQMAKYNMAAHNSYLEVLAATGLVGMAVIIALFVCSFITIIKKYVLFDADENFILATVICLTHALVGVFISDLFFLFTIGSNLFWMSLGFAVHGGVKSEKVSYLYRIVAKVLKREND